MVAMPTQEPFESENINGLITIDLTKTDPRLLEAYLGEEGARAFLDFHDA